MKKPSLSKTLADKRLMSRKLDKDAYDKAIDRLQLRTLRAQQGIWHSKARAIILFEGFDAAGKGGAIRRITEKLDPRGIHVHPIGAPTPKEQGTHWLFRFWTRMPPPGTIAVFDRSWYGRVLVERVEKLAPKDAWKRAYGEINELERMLTDDGVALIKIFLAMSKGEQLKRFHDRESDPYKRWKLTPDDLRARKHWDAYVEAVDDMLKCTSTKNAPWHVVPADDKRAARIAVLEHVTRALGPHADWIERQVKKRGRR